MARTKGFDEKQALQSAMLLFWKKGYSATSMKELERAMGLNPTSIYNAFGSKKELFERALQLYLDTELMRFIHSVENAQTMREALRDLLNAVISLHYNKAHPGGCMVVLSLLESEQHDKDTQEMLDSALHMLRDTLVKRLKKAQQTNEIKPSIDIKVFANHVTALVTGIITLAKAQFTKKELENLIDSCADTLLEKYINV